MEERQGTNKVWRRAFSVKVLPGILLGGVSLVVFLVLPSDKSMGADLRFFLGVLLLMLSLFVWIISHEVVEDAARRQLGQETHLVPQGQFPAEIKVDDRVMAGLARQLGLVEGTVAPMRQDLVKLESRIEELQKGRTVESTGLARQMGLVEGTVTPLKQDLVELGRRIEELQKRKPEDYPEISTLFGDIRALQQGLSVVANKVEHLDRSDRPAGVEHMEITALRDGMDVLKQRVNGVQSRLDHLDRSVPTDAGDRRSLESPIIERVVESAPRRPPAETPLGLSREVKEQLLQVSTDLQKAYETPEESRSTFVMAPFWWACADGLEQTAMEAGQRWKELAGQTDGVARAAIEILRGSITALGQTGYRLNTTLMPGIFFSGGRPIDETSADVEQGFTEVLKETSPRVAFDKAAAKIIDLKVRLRSGDIALHLRSVSTVVMEGKTQESRRSAEGMAAWALIGYAMAKYMDKHLGKYLIQS